MIGEGRGPAAVVAGSGPALAEAEAVGVVVGEEAAEEGGGVTREGGGGAVVVVVVAGVETPGGVVYKASMARSVLASMLMLASGWVSRIWRAIPCTSCNRSMMLSRHAIRYWKGMFMAAVIMGVGAITP